MANEENLKPFNKITEKEQRKIASNGGKASVKARREKKTIRVLLDELMQTSVKDVPQISKLAQKLGVESEKNVKDIFLLVATLNSLKTANLSDLERIANLLGEKNEENENNGILDELAKYLKGENKENVDK